MTRAKHSARFETVRKYYDRGLWDALRVANAVKCTWITEAEYEEICGEPYSVEDGAEG